MHASKGFGTPGSTYKHVPIMPNDNSIAACALETKDAATALSCSSASKAEPLSLAKDTDIYNRRKWGQRAALFGRNPTSSLSNTGTE